MTHKQQFIKNRSNFFGRIILAYYLFQKTPLFYCSTLWRIFLIWVITSSSSDLSSTLATFLTLLLPSFLPHPFELSIKEDTNRQNHPLMHFIQTLISVQHNSSFFNSFFLPWPLDLTCFLHFYTPPSMPQGRLLFHCLL